MAFEQRYEQHAGERLTHFWGHISETETRSARALDRSIWDAQKTGRSQCKRIVGVSTGRRKWGKSLKLKGVFKALIFFYWRLKTLESF